MYLTIFQAIEKRYLLQFHYCGYYRIVEPHVYGSDRRYKDVIRAYQIAGADEFGKHRGWKWFRTDKIEELEVLATHFAGPHPGSGYRVERLDRIYCQFKLRVPVSPRAIGLPPGSVVDC